MAGKWVLLICESPLWNIPTLRIKDESLYWVPKSKYLSFSVRVTSGKWVRKTLTLSVNFWVVRGRRARNDPKICTNDEFSPRNFKSRKFGNDICLNDVFLNFYEENEWEKHSLEWGKHCQNDTNDSYTWCPSWGTRRNLIWRKIAAISAAMIENHILKKQSIFDVFMKSKKFTLDVNSDLRHQNLTLGVKYLAYGIKIWRLASNTWLTGQEIWRQILTPEVKFWLHTSPL